MSRTPATYPGCLSIGALFYTPVTDPEILFIGAHHCSLDDCSLAQEILPGFGYTVLYTLKPLYGGADFLTFRRVV